MRPYAPYWIRTVYGKWYRTLDDACIDSARRCLRLYSVVADDRTVAQIAIRFAKRWSGNYGATVRGIHRALGTTPDGGWNWTAHGEYETDYTEPGVVCPRCRNRAEEVEEAYWYPRRTLKREEKIVKTIPVCKRCEDEIERLSKKAAEYAETISMAQWLLRGGLNQIVKERNEQGNHSTTAYHRRFADVLGKHRYSRGAGRNAD